tara:strand:- start:114 stop:848 length:735 start_codon:yes stop_codon:yes gene_type:complete
MFPTRRITLGGDKFRDEYSLSFDGTDDYVDIADNFSLNFGASTDFTITFWVKYTGDGYMGIVSKGVGSLNGGYEIVVDAGSGKIMGRIEKADGSSRVDVKSASEYNDGFWHHVAAVYDRSANLTIYVDSVSDGTGDISSIGDCDATHSLDIGRQSSGNNYLNGNISDVALYSSAFTSSQVKTIYNGREPYNHKEGVASSSLVSWWRMGDGLENHSGSTIYDMSTNSNNGTMTNMASDDFTGDTP